MLLKKGISIVLVLAVVLLSLPLVGTLTFSANWEDVLSYQTINGGIEIEITGCDWGASGELVIPGEIDGLPVTSIGGWAFEDCSSLTGITIPDSVTSIGDYAFEDCTSLTSITIPDSVTSIGYGAFYNCSSLTNITIPDGVASIGYMAFYNCSSLTNITIPDSVTSIGDYAFYECSSLTSITIPNSVTSIGNGTFASCSSLTSITIPDSVTSIGYMAFYNCSSLTSVTIPDSVTSIGDWAFEDCSSLTGITIPDSVTNIGYEAFYGCEHLTIYCYKDSHAYRYAIDNDFDYELVSHNIEVKPESNLIINKDNEFDFVLSTTDKITASSLISNFNGGNIKIYKDGKVLGSDELVGTGCVVKLIGDGGEVIDSLTVVIKGDVDGDGVVGVTDARTVLRVAVELENFNTNAPAKLAGDVDGDGSISVTEARTILRVAVGLENSF